MIMVKPISHPADMIAGNKNTTVPAGDWQMFMPYSAVE
jgi:hypothetical protein